VSDDTEATPSPTSGAEHQRRYLDAIPALLSGGLAPGERADLQGHLRECASCRDELVELAALPGLLARLRPAAAVSRGGPATDLPDPGARLRLVEEALRARSRHRRRAGALAVAAALIVVAGAGVGVARLRPSPPAAPTPAVAAPALVAMTPMVNGSGPGSGAGSGAVSGAVAAVDKAWGSALSVTVTGGRPGQRLKLVVIDSEGHAETVAWWVTGNKAVRCQGSSSIHRAAVAQVQVRTVADEPLLTYDA
jgi:hypothetical protein